MTRLPILLFSLFHYGRAQETKQETVFPFAFPLAVRSPYLNCWGHPDVGDNYGIVPTTFSSDSWQAHSDWDPSLAARYFLAWHITKTNCTRALTWPSLSASTITPSRFWEMPCMTLP